MKTILRLTSLLCLLLLAGQSFSQSLYVHDPHSWGGQQTATIEEASLTVKPKGVYMEYGLYLTISAKGSNYYGGNNNPLEIVMNFCLPEGSIIHDSWLWVGNDIMQAILIDRGIATQIYEGIVNRRKDPSILTKNYDGCYDLRVYPLPANETRKLKITYLVPVRWTRNLVSSPLPLSLLQTSVTTPDLNLTIHTDATFDQPSVTELGILPFISNTGNGIYTSKIISGTVHSHDNLELSFASPLQNGWFACDYPVGSSGGYYQLVFHPQQALQLAKPKKIAILLELDGAYSRLQPDQMFTKTKEMLNEYLTPTDSFNVFFPATGGIKQLSNEWLPATPLAIQSAFAGTPTMWQGTGVTATLVSTATGFIRTSGNEGEIILISNNNQYTSTQSANQMITSLVTAANPNIPINVLNFTGDNGYDYYGGYYSYMDYTYQNLTAQTGGNYVKHQFDGSQAYWDWEWNYYYYYYKPITTFSDLMHSMFGSLDAAPENYSLSIEPDNGFCYSEIELSKNNLSSGQAMTFVGKYYGSSPLTVEYQGIQDDTLVSYRAQLQTYTGDSLTRKMWAGAYISSMEQSMQSNATKRAIIDTSMANRVLSLYTAFLALEPNDTLQACENCEDDSDGGNGGGTPTVGIGDPTDLAASLAAAPNPFSNSVTITISTDTEELKNAELKIFNMMGQEVKIFKGIFATSQDSVTLTWNGEDESGNALPNGVYMAMLITSSGKQIVKLVKAG